MLALARSLLGPFPQAFYSSIYLVLEWWIIIIQLQPKENSVRTDFVGLQWPTAQLNLPLYPFNSGAREALAPRGWYVYVSLPVLPR